MSSDWDSTPDGIAWEAVQRIWDEVHDWTHAIPSLDMPPSEVAIQGKCILHYKVDLKTWTGLSGKSYRESYWSPILENPTWMTVVAEFDKAICAVQDYHHVFLEGVGPTTLQHDPFTYDEDSKLVGIPIYEFHTGS